MSTALVFPIYDSSTTTKETNTFIESAVKRQGKILAVRRSSPRKRSSENALESPGGSSPKSPRQMSPRKNAKTTPSNKPKGCHSPLKTPPNTQRSKSVSGVKKSPLENQNDLRAKSCSAKDTFYLLCHGAGHQILFDSMLNLIM
ncbi:uncharacterized protein LOC141884746 isoform X3 [Acropora palmata]|uniref:uncharacterized protein LOC141884746 isoform X3 n=1 Tax=Acropora palmata TaxID=6131 RepID=UPI003DA19BF0